MIISLFIVLFSLTTTFAQTVELQPEADTTVDTASPTVVSNGKLEIGYIGWFFEEAEIFLLKFDLAKIPSNASIHSAHLKLYGLNFFKKQENPDHFNCCGRIIFLKLQIFPFCALHTAFNHLDNNHPQDKEQVDAMKNFNEKASEFFNFVINILKNRNFDSIDELVQRRNEMINLANEILLQRIKILKKTQKGVKVSVTYMEMLSETKNLFQNVVQLRMKRIMVRRAIF